MVYVALQEDWKVYVCDKTFHLKASQQYASSSQGKMPAVKVADVITAT
jgi:hypothetical protein